jgi:kinetochore protein Spc24
MCVAFPELTRQHTLASQAAQRPKTQPTPQEHNTEVRRLEQEQYTTGKQLNEEEKNLTKKESELIKWKSDKEEVAQREVGQDDWANGGM